jgi:hypothetical protein
LSVKSLSKYFQFSHFDFLLNYIRHGRHSLVTFDEKNQPIVSTNFYIDGDVLHWYYESGMDDVPDEEKRKLIDAHMAKVEMNLGSIELFATQLQAFITMIMGAYTSIITFLNYGLETSILSTLSISALIYIFKRNLARFVFWIIKMILRFYLNTLKREIFDG